MKTPGRRELVLYAAGSGDFNPLHYDTEFPQAKIIGDNIVHGRMKFAVLGELVSNWLAHTRTHQDDRLLVPRHGHAGQDLHGQGHGRREARAETARSSSTWRSTSRTPSGARTTPGTATVVLFG